MKRAWGFASAILTGGSTGVIEPGNPTCSPAFDCGPVGTVPGARAAARADATKMNVGVQALGSSDRGTAADGSVEIKDALIFAVAGTRTFDIRLDLGLSATAGADAFFSFAIVLGDGDDRHVAFGFDAREENGVRRAEFRLDNNATVVELTSIPGSFEHTLNISVPLAGSVPILISANARADAGALESGLVNAFNSAWLGISGEFTSANGYSYPGFAAAVPEPSRAALLLAGLAIMMLGLRRDASAASRAH